MSSHCFYLINSPSAPWQMSVLVAPPTINWGSSVSSCEEIQRLNDDKHTHTKFRLLNTFYDLWQHISHGTAILAPTSGLLTKHSKQMSCEGVAQQLQRSEKFLSKLVLYCLSLQTWNKTVLLICLFTCDAAKSVSSTASNCYCETNESCSTELLSRVFPRISSFRSEVCLSVS